MNTRIHKTETSVEALTKKLDHLVEAGRYFEALDIAGALITLAEDDASILDALRSKAHCFDKLGAPELEVMTYDDVISRYSSSDDPVIHTIVDRMMYNKAVTLSSDPTKTEAIRAYEEVRKRVATREDADSRDTLARSLFNEAAIYLTAGDETKALDVLDEMEEIFSETEQGGVRDQLARAASLRAEILVRRGEVEEGLLLYGKAIKALEHPAGEIPPLLVAGLRGNRAIAIAKADRTEESLAELESLDADLMKEQDEAARRMAASTQVNIAVTQKALGRLDEALKTLARARRTLGSDEKDDAESIRDRIEKLLVKYKEAKSEAEGATSNKKSEPA